MAYFDYLSTKPFAGVASVDGWREGYLGSAPLPFPIALLTEHWGPVSGIIWAEMTVLGTPMSCGIATREMKVKKRTGQLTICGFEPAS